MNKLSGFTLIELIMTIVILGILAATALPKFTNQSQAARINTIKMLQGQLNELADAWYLYAKSQGCKGNLQVAYTNNNVTLNTYGCYPEAGSNIGGNEIDVVANTTGFAISLSGDTNHTYFDLNDAPTPASCRVDYLQSFGPTSRPVISVVTGGC